MDGPWWIDLERQKSGVLRLKLIDDRGAVSREVATIEVDAEQMGHELLRVADVVDQRCAELGWSSPDLENLKRDCAALGLVAK